MYPLVLVYYSILTRGMKGLEMKLKADRHFNLKDTMECGQAFRYERIHRNTYEIISRGQRVIAAQKDGVLALSCDMAAYESLWADYFDMGSDYGFMKAKLLEADGRLAGFIESKPGIHILKQEPFEMLLTFIISQNKAMTHIKELVKRLADTYGDRVEDELGSYHRFPTSEQLTHVSEVDFRTLKVGFRAPYLVDAVEKVATGKLDMEGLKSMSTHDAREQLLTVKGVGRKVADCVLLFGYHRMDVFPLDVWMKRAMNRLYFPDGPGSDREILALAQEKFGDLSGIAQQYIFYGTVDGE